MFTVKTNIKVVANLIRQKLEKLNDREYLLRPVALDVMELMTTRIHEDGKASDESQIGTYNSKYLQLRERKYNRSADTKIIVSLTRELENDWSVLATPKGYGIGFKNVFNTQKARWVEENKGKIIFNLSKPEFDFAIERINDLVSEAIQ